MKLISGLLAIIAWGVLLPNATAESAKKRLSDARVREILIHESIAEYSGTCPCPYSRAQNGSRCGRRSAYSREAGEAPLCFRKDVTTAMVQTYRDSNPEQ